MAKKVRTMTVSDISGNEANDGETVKFTYRGVSYAIDLTKDEAETFDQAMELYTGHAQRQRRRRSAGTRKARTDRDQRKAIRE